MDKNQPENRRSFAPFKASSLRRPILLSCAALGLSALVAPAVSAQGPGSAPPNANQQPAAQNDTSITAGQASLYQATGTNGATPSSQSYKGSIVSGKNTGTVIDLSLDDAIARGLRQNLGIILQGSSVRNANGQRMEQLQSLLPTVSAGASIEVEQVNLAAYGLKFPGVKSVIGPFQVVDFRAYLTQSLFNLNSLESYIASRHNFASQQLTADDARDMVVLTVGNAYLLCIADAARITAVESELKTSKLTLDQAVDAHDAGTSPRLDVLRAKVDYQTEQQTLISTTNQLAKDKIALARVIGLPLDQKYALTDTTPFKALDSVDPDAAFAAALKARKDLQAAQQTVSGAEATRKAAFADRLPTASFSGDFGDLGTTPGHSHGTFTATGTVTAPILQIEKDRGELQSADAALNQAKDRLADQAQQVNADIRSSILDIETAAKLVEAAKSNVDLAGEALSEAQQRFHAGVADNLPVSQAQTTFEQANDQYISALYQHNVAKLQLARALGVAQTNYKDYLGGK